MFRGFRCVCDDIRRSGGVIFRRALSQYGGGVNGTCAFDKIYTYHNTLISSRSVLGTNTLAF